jgi:2-keto-4-pentenoate hydratase
MSGVGAVAGSRSEAAARLLIEARERHRPLAALPPECRPASLAEGLAVQEALIALDGRRTAGWKIGCTSEYAQKLLGADRPFPGRVFAATVHASPAALARSAFIAIGLEPEFAFRLGRDLPPRAATYGREEVAAAIEVLLPSCEIVETRFGDWRSVGAACLAADNGCNGALVLGEAVRDWRNYDLARHKVTLAINGETVAVGTGEAVLGHPLTALAWLANHLRERGSGLAAGEVVTTGTVAGIHYLERGDEAVADYGPLGRVSLRVAG